MTSAIALYASWIMAKDTLSDSGAFFNDDIKIAYFTSLSDRLCQILWVPSWVFDVSISVRIMQSKSCRYDDKGY